MSKSLTKKLFFMKKKLLLSIFVLSGTVSFAQTIFTQNFNSLAIGNVGTSFTGASAGAGGLYTYSTNGTAPTTATNAGNANFQIVANDVTHANVFQITGTNGDKGGRYAWIGGLAAAWTARTAGNNIIEVEYDFYTGAGGGPSLNTTGLYIYDVTQAKILGGLSYNTNTRIISGVGYYAGTTTTNYQFYLGAGGTNITLAANTWVRVGVSFNKTTGKITWKGPGFNGNVTGAATGIDPDEVDFTSFSGTTTTPPATNTAAATTLIDNFVTRASAADTLLGVESVTLAENKFSVFPNPASNLISISNSENILVNEITITDLNGRVVKQSKYNNTSEIQINVSDLASGMYLMNITSDQGSATKKIIKN